MIYRLGFKFLPELICLKKCIDSVKLVRVFSGDIELLKRLCNENCQGH